MNNYFFFTLVALSLSSNVVIAQQKPEDYLRQQEQIKRMLLTKEMDSGVYYMNMGKYELADSKFKYVLASIKGVPSDLAYYFGKNSYLRGQYKQSVDWLNKYIQLKGTNGQFSEEAVQWLHKAETELLNIRAKEAEKTEQVLSSNYDIDCGPSGKVICPVCHGDHVIIKKGAFGDIYQTCPYCNDHGLLTCAEYNLLIRGELKPKF
jgi:tetratricopeptide (TPR) repeat protein